MPEPEQGRLMTVAEPTHEGLLLSYTEKPVKGFMVVDAHGVCEDGVVIHTNFLYELRNTADPVRVRIAEGTTRGEALYYLREIMDMLREDWYRLDIVDLEGHGWRPKPRKEES
jgi:hypothetical protein